MDARNDRHLWAKAFARRVASFCRTQDRCWLDQNVPCPLRDTFCHNVTMSDWAYVLKHVFKEYPV